MKLLAIFVAGILADKKHPDPLNHPEYRIQSMKEHVTFIFDTWMGGCDADAKNAKKSAKFEKNLNGFMDRALSYFNRCSKRNNGGELGVNPEFNEDSDNGFRELDEEYDRLNKKDPEEAIKQLSDGAVKHWVNKFIKRYGCGEGEKRKTFFHKDQPETPRWYAKLQKMGARTLDLYKKCGN